MDCRRFFSTKLLGSTHYQCIRHFLLVVIMASFYIPEFYADYHHYGLDMFIIIRSSIKITFMIVMFFTFFPKHLHLFLLFVLFLLNIFNLLWAIHVGKVFWIHHMNIIMGSTIINLLEVLGDYWALISMVVISSLFVFIFFKPVPTMNEFLHRNKLVIGILSICILIFFNTENRKFGAIKKITSAHPILAFTYSLYDQFKFHVKSKNRKNIVDEIRVRTKLKGPSIQVLIIGETLRRDHLSINNYCRSTTPKIESVSNLVNYSNTISGAGYTKIAIPLLITETHPNHFEEYISSPSLINIFNKINHKTYWVSNQLNAFAEFELLPKESDSFIRVSGLGSNHHDERVISIVKKLIQDDPFKSLFIVIHMKGNHYSYKSNYGSEFRKFLPDSYKNWDMTYAEELINSYDNSILQTDNTIYSIIQILKNSSRPSNLVFTADHGESLFENQNPQNRGHGFALNRPTYEVPLFIWSSNNYSTAYPKLVNNLKRNKNSPVDHGNIFHTILELNQISYEGFVPQKSISNIDFVSNQFRSVIVGYNRTMYYEDIPFQPPYPYPECNNFKELLTAF